MSARVITSLLPHSQIRNLTKNFNYASQRKAAIPTLDTWLKSLLLTKIDKKLEDFGVVELMDLNDMSDKQFKELKLTPLQVKLPLMHNPVAGKNNLLFVSTPS